MQPRRPPKATLDKAVEAMRVYLGSVDFAGIPDQGRLYRQAMLSVNKIAGITGMDVADVWNQIAGRARSLGVVRPIPGRHL